jgi:hypothetical protein
MNSERETKGDPLQTPQEEKGTQLFSHKISNAMKRDHRRTADVYKALGQHSVNVLARNRTKRTRQRRPIQVRGPARVAGLQLGRPRNAVGEVGIETLNV